MKHLLAVTISLLIAATSHAAGAGYLIGQEARFAAASVEGVVNISAENAVHIAGTTSTTGLMLNAPILQSFQPTSFVIASSGKRVLEIHADGRIETAKDADLDEGARLFFDYISGALASAHSDLQRLLDALDILSDPSSSDAAKDAARKVIAGVQSQWRASKLPKVSQ